MMDNSEQIHPQGTMSLDGQHHLQLVKLLIQSQVYIGLHMKGIF
jgi:hypothetical protein